MTTFLAVLLLIAGPGVLVLAIIGVVWLLRDILMHMARVK